MAAVGGGGQPLRWAWIGRVGYRAAWETQEALRRAVLDGRAPDTLLLCEHDPVITLGRSSRPDHLRRPREAIARLGVPVVETSRGGSATWHGPGQLVGYPVVRLSRGVLAHVEAIAGALCDALADLGVRAAFRREAPGVWCGAAKVASIGVHVHRRVAIHGFALNLTSAADGFELIVPCGRDAPVLSLRALGCAAPSPEAFAPGVAAALARRLGRAPVRCGAAEALGAAR